MKANAPAVRPTIIATSNIFLTTVLNMSDGMTSKTNSVANPATRRIAMEAVNFIIPVIESPFHRASASDYERPLNHILPHACPRGHGRPPQAGVSRGQTDAVMKEIKRPDNSNPLRVYCFHIQRK